MSSFAGLMPARSRDRAIGNYYETQNIIAIVDDDESVCRALRRLVRSLGMEASTFTSGQEFIDLLEAMPSFDPDCVVLDVQMPGLNGLEVQERLVNSGSRLPVIFITAHDDAQVRMQAMEAGAVECLSKPFDDDVLLEKVRAALTG